MKRILVLMAGVVLSSAVAANEIESLDSIRDAARMFLELQTADLRRQPEVVIGHLDSRLRLPACAEPLEAFFPTSGTQNLVGSTLLGVRCSTPKPWSIYVQATLTVTEEVVIATRPLARNAVIGPGDVQLADRDISRLNGGYLTDIAQVIGQTTSRPVSAGTALTTNLVEASRVVRRGDRVAIVAGGGGVNVRMEGEALADGARGDSIPVKNLSSGRRVEAEVVGPGEVRVRF